MSAQCRITFPLLADPERAADRALDDIDFAHTIAKIIGEWPVDLAEYLRRACRRQSQAMEKLRPNRRPR